MLVQYSYNSKIVDVERRVALMELIQLKMIHIYIFLFFTNRSSSLFNRPNLKIHVCKVQRNLDKKSHTLKRNKLKAE